NATAAIAVAHSLGADVERAAAGLAGYGGTRRRFEERGIAGGVRVIDDYAHHPTELRAVLAAARGVVTDGGRVWAIFQPHLYSRTMEFREEFGQALGLADEVVVLDVFPAREDPVPGVTGALIADRVPHDHVTFEESFAEAAPFVAARCRPGALVRTLGAGGLPPPGPGLLRALERCATWRPSPRPAPATPPPPISPESSGPAGGSSGVPDSSASASSPSSSLSPASPGSRRCSRWRR